MAPFNPDVKDVKPVNPIGWSKAADVPSSFASGLSEAIKGIGNVIQTGAKGAVDIVEDYAKKAVQEEITPVRDDYISQLAGTDFSLKMGLNGQSNASISSGSQSDLAPPGDLQREIKTLSILPDARANGKISPSDYYARLISAAADLRSRYPVGFRDYIDKEISKITGIDPANAYMHSLIGDINASLTHSQTERNKISGKILDLMGSDPINGRDMYIGFTNGTKTVAQALDFIGRNEAIDVTNKRNAARFQNIKDEDILAKADATKSFTQWANGAVDSWIKGDIQKKGLTQQAIENLITDPDASKKIKPEEWVQYTVDIRQQMLAAASKLRQEYTRVDSTQPKAWATILGPDGKGDKIMQDALEPYQRILDAIEKKDVGLLFTNQRMVEAANSAMAERLYKDPSMKFFFGTMDAIRKHGGEAAVTQFFTQGLAAKFGIDWGTYIQTAKAEMGTPSTDPNAANKQNKNIVEFIKGTQSAESKLGIKAPDSYKEVFSLVYATDNRPSILNPNTPPAIRQAIAQNFFSDKTQGFLNLINADAVNDKGRRMEGRETLFKMFTSKRVVDAISQMDDKTKSDYYNWVQKSYEDVFKQGIQDLANQSRPGEAAAGNTKQIGAVVGWNDKTNTLVVNKPYLDEMRQREMRRGMPAGGMTNLELTVDKINSGISGLANVLIKQGYDNATVQTKVLESLNLQINQYRMINNLPTQFKDSLDEKDRQLKEERARERREKAARENAKFD